jgi:hypothetical protein
MMRRWVLDVKPTGEHGSGVSIRLALAGTATAAGIDVVTVCHDLGQFRAELAELKNELDQMLAAAETKIKEHATAGQELPKLDPEGAWKKMQACASQEDMFDYFNAFETDARKEIADYILGHASMFKGRGPVFAEHYSLSSFRLET